MKVLLHSIYNYEMNIIEFIISSCLTPIILIILASFLILYIKTKIISYLINSISATLLLIYDILIKMSFMIGIMNKKTPLDSPYIELLLKSSDIALLILFIFLSSTSVIYFYNKSNIRKFTMVALALVSILSLFFVLTFIVELQYFKDIIYNITNSDVQYKTIESIFTDNSISTKYMALIAMILMTASIVTIFLSIDTSSIYRIRIRIVLSTIIFLCIVLLIESTRNIGYITYNTINKIFFAVSIYVISIGFTTLKRFADGVFEEIIYQNIVDKKIENSIDIIRDLSILSTDINSIEKQINGSKECIYDIVKENKDALNSMNKKYELISNSSDDFFNIYKDKGDSLQNIDELLKYIINTFDDSKEKIVENRATFLNTINKIIESSLNQKDMKYISEALKNTSKNFKKKSENIIKNIEKSMSKFENIHDVTGSIQSTIDFIKDTADKTSLLSINAGIKASKAGTVGRSFAVIAKEIGTVASENIRGIEQIEKILSSIFESIKDVELSSSSIKKESDLFREGINDMISEIDNLVLEISKYDICISEKMKTIKELDDNQIIEKTTKDQSYIINLIKESTESPHNKKADDNLNIEKNKSDIDQIAQNINRLSELELKTADLSNILFNSIDQANIEAINLDKVLSDENTKEKDSDNRL